MELVFWLASIFIMYTYAGYPLLISLIARMLPYSMSQKKLDADVLPSISVVIPVYNEESRVLHKIQNIRQLRYPQKLIEIIIVSDGSTDNTDKIVLSCSDVRLVSYKHRKGKPTALNAGVNEANNDVVLFTDVRQQVDIDALTSLVTNLMQENIGAVSGELIFRDPKTNTGRNVGLYWEYEKWIRKAESAVHSTAGVTGALYVIRRHDYRNLPEDTLLDDFEIPMQILQRGKRVIFDSNAVIYDDVQEDRRNEQARKIRTLTGNYQSLLRNPWLLSPSHNPVFIQFLSHKIFRLFVPYAMVATLMTSLLLDAIFYKSIAFIQIIFYLLAFLAYLIPSLRKNRLINLIIVFISMNVAAIVALKNTVTSKIEVRWVKT